MAKLILFDYVVLTSVIVTGFTFISYAILSWRLRKSGYKWPTRLIVRLILLFLVLATLMLPSIGSGIYIAHFPGEAPDIGEVFALEYLFKIIAWVWGVYAVCRLMMVLHSYKSRNTNIAS